jgi:hypothetical protein
MKIVNLTPHELDICAVDGSTFTVQASGTVCRVVPSASSTELPPVRVESGESRFCPECVGNTQDMGSCGTCGGAGWIPVTVEIPAVRDPWSLPSVVGLPEPEVETIYIVSRPVRDLLDRMAERLTPSRPDVWSPGGLLCDGAGVVIGCKGIRQ